MNKLQNEQNITELSNLGNNDEDYLDSDENNYSYDDYDEEFDYYEEIHHPTKHTHITPILRSSSSRHPTPAKINETNIPLNPTEFLYQDGS